MKANASGKAGIYTTVVILGCHCQHACCPGIIDIVTELLIGRGPVDLEGE